MAADTTHPVLQQPSSPDSTIWRYMDFAKYIALLKSSALYFARLDKMEDPFEGTITKAEYDDIVATAQQGEQKGGLPENWKGRYFDILLQNARNMRRSCYVNCWHFSEYESEAMWKLYSQSGFAISLKSKYSKLRDCLPTASEGATYVGPFLGKVSYVDHFSEKLPTGNGLVPIMNKRPSFAHEQECRALIWRPEPNDFLFRPNPEEILLQYPVGLHLKIDINLLVDAVLVSPLAPKWFIECVVDVTRKYDRDWEVGASSLSTKPFI